MNITQMTVSFKRVQSLPGYCNVSSGLTVTADLSADDDPFVVEQRLHSELELCWPRRHHTHRLVTG